MSGRILANERKNIRSAGSRILDALRRPIERLEEHMGLQGLFDGSVTEPLNDVKHPRSIEENGWFLDEQDGIRERHTSVPSTHGPSLIATRHRPLGARTKVSGSLTEFSRWFAPIPAPGQLRLAAVSCPTLSTAPE